MKIVIIEDEPKTAKDLAKTLLNVLPHAEIVAYIESVQEGLLYFDEKHDINLIFSDIQLGDGLSFEIFEQKPLPIPIIFCTAYNDYTLRAFKTCGIDYILKPFSTTVIRQALDKYQTLFQKNTQQTAVDTDWLAELKRQLRPKTNSILVFRGDKIIPLDTENIALFCIENGIVYAHCFNEQKWGTTYKLEDLEQKLNPQFFRTNRQFLVNRRAIKEASQHYHRKLQVHLCVPFSATILVGKEKVSAFLEWLECG